MPAMNLFNLTGRVSPLTLEEGLRILKRDGFRCQYCGLDGGSNFENSLVMSVDFIKPRARKGKKDPSNLVAACRSCNMLKGNRVFANFEDAKAYVLKRRADLRQEWERQKRQLQQHASTA